MGILLCGSYAYGTPGPYSDVDLFVLADITWRQKRVVFKEGVEIELFINPTQQIEKEFNNLTSSTIDMFARGRIIIDSKEIIADLQNRAINLKEEGPNAISDRKLSFLRYSISDKIKDLQNIDDQEEITFRLVFYDCVIELMKIFFKIKNMWPVKPQYFIDRLVNVYPDDTKIFINLMNHDIPRYKRRELLIEYVDDLLVEQCGIIRDQTWETEPEQVVFDEVKETV